MPGEQLMDLDVALCRLIFACTTMRIMFHQESIDLHDFEGVRRHHKDSWDVVSLGALIACVTQQRYLFLYEAEDPIGSHCFCVIRLCSTETVVELDVFLGYQLFVILFL